MLINDEFFMKEALKQAEAAVLKGEVPVGAVIVAENVIIARAHNMTETLQDVTAHAEMLAITSASNHLGGKYLPDCTLYVTLEPCIMCASAISWAQLKRIVWGASDPKRGFTTLNRNILHPKTEVTCGIMQDDASALLKGFFEKRRRL
jgi:tRNA(adenine34) deaminase